MKKIISAIFVLVFFWCGAQIAHAEENTGFVSGVWFSNPNFFVGDTVRIYAAVYNNTDYDVRGEAVFKDGGQTIGTASFSLTKGRVQEVWIDWKPSKAGDRDVSVEFVKMEKLEVGKEPAAITWQQVKLSSKKFVDLDSDKDGVGNTEEIKKGTDPYKSETIVVNDAGKNNVAENNSSSTSFLQSATDKLVDLLKKPIGEIAKSQTNTSVSSTDSSTGNWLSYFTKNHQLINMLNERAGDWSGSLSPWVEKKRSELKIAINPEVVSSTSSSVPLQDISNVSKITKKIFLICLAVASFLLGLPIYVWAILIFVFIIWAIRSFLRRRGSLPDDF